MIAQLSKTALALLLIAGGVVAIVIFNPPHTVCDAQKEAFKESQKSFLYLDEKRKAIKKTKFEEMYTMCKTTNTPGGCYELFRDLKHALTDLKNVPRECGSAVGSMSEVQKVIWQSAELLVRIAWGSKPPQTFYEKFAWLDTADMALFCQLKDTAEILYGSSSWSNFRERMFKELPGAKELPRNQVWDHMILSVNCAKYR